uniref:Uncharacterized protein n=1 Tax=Acrobeloides nanus TaxID=290746 RepID=A0A914D183_9BILA
MKELHLFKTTEKRSKDDIFNEFVPYILKALKNISLETKEYSDALIADYSFNIHSL